MKSNREKAVQDVFAAYHKSLHEDMRLGTDALKTVLWACEQAIDDQRSDIVSEVYDRLKQQNELSVHVCQSAMRILERKKSYVRDEHGERVRKIDIIHRDYLNTSVKVPGESPVFISGKGYDLFNFLLFRTTFD